MNNSEQNRIEAAREITELERILAYEFQDRTLLQAAVTHPSYPAEQEEEFQHNQRLEFLGDAVLQLAMTDILYRHFPERDEGELTKLRAATTNDDTLAMFAKQLRLGEFVLLGKGEAETGGRERPSTLSDALEAVLGALYLDGGFDPALNLCRRLSGHVLEQGDSIQSRINPKGTLQELTQQRFQKTPVYETIEVSGPEHSPQFKVLVRVDSDVLGSGCAGNRKKAEKEAAESALVYLQQS